MKHISPYIDAGKKTIEFCLQSDYENQISIEGVRQVSLAGSFNHWSQDVPLLSKDKDGVWKIQIPMLPKGKYHYKFFVDDKIGWRTSAILIVNLMALAVFTAF